jgi:hypothetical protein
LLVRTQIKRAVARRVEPAIGLARALESFDRPPWLYRLGGAAPTGKQCFRPPRPVTDADIELCRRLTTAYRLAQSEAPTASGMWSHSVFQHRQRALIDALQRGEPSVLAELLSSMFRSDFVLGMAPGSMARERRPGPLARLSWLMAMNKLVALAEAIGAVRVENPEQGRVGSALRAGLDDIVDGIEAQLGLSLDFPGVGAAYGVVAAGRLITPESPDQLYGAARLRDVIDAYVPSSDEPTRIVEIGGGYGGMAYWLLRMIEARYVIVDLPIVGVLQGYFLSQALGHDAVALYGESPAQVTIVPDHALASVQRPFDVLANKDSLPEIPVDAALGYLEWARVAGIGVFYSYNHESAVVFDGAAQNVVSELVERVGGFARVRRDASWLRRGYVEEVFLPAAGKLVGR